MTLLAGLDAWGWLAVVGIVLLSGWLHGALGLGFPLLATPALAVMMDVRSAILVTLLPTMAVNIASIAGNRGGWDGARRHAPLLVFVLIGSALGATALAVFDPSPFGLLLALLILLYLWGGARVSRNRLERRPWLFMGLFGLAAGFAAGTTNAMVTVLIIYFLSLETPRAVMVPALNACFLAGKVAQAVVLAAAGFVTGALVLETAPLALAALAALALGQRIQTALDTGTYRKILRVVLLLLAMVLVARFATGHG